MGNDCPTSPAALKWMTRRWTMERADPIFIKQKNWDQIEQIRIRLELLMKCVQQIIRRKP